jgi:hypothetical protein
MFGKGFCRKEVCFLYLSVLLTVPVKNEMRLLSRSSTHSMINILPNELAHPLSGLCPAVSSIIIFAKIIVTAKANSFAKDY